MSRSLAWSVLLAVLLVPGILAAQTTTVPASPAVLNPGDAVRIQVWRQPEFSGEFEVTGSGVIAHPLYRQVEVGAKPVDEVEALLRSFLARYETDPNFVVEALFRIPVAGEIRQPDVYSLRPETTVSQAVALAGGPTERGRLDRVTLRREGREYRLDLTDPESRLRELQVRSGDEIVLERRVDLFRDFIAPSASIVAAVAALLRLLL